MVCNFYCCVLFSLVFSPSYQCTHAYIYTIEIPIVNLYPVYHTDCTCIAHTTFNLPILVPPPRIVELQLVIDETVCESAALATVCVQLRTDTEREVTAIVQTSDISARSESCMLGGVYNYIIRST